MSFESFLNGANKATVQDGTERLKELSKEGINAQELKELNAMRLQGMREWVAKEQRAIVEPKKPDASAPQEAMGPYQSEYAAYLEMKKVLDGFDSAIRNLKASYESSKSKIGAEAKADIAALDATLKDVNVNDAATDKVLDAVAAAKEAKAAADTKKAETTTPAAASKPAEAKAEGVGKSEFVPASPKETRNAKIVTEHQSKLDEVSNSLSKSDSKAKKSDLDETKRLLDEVRKAPNDKNVRALQKDLVGYEGVKMAVDGALGPKTLSALLSVAHVEAPKEAKKTLSRSGKPQMKTALPNDGTGAA